MKFIKKKFRIKIDFFKIVLWKQDSLVNIRKVFYVMKILFRSNYNNMGIAVLSFNRLYQYGAH